MNISLNGIFNIVFILLICVFLLMTAGCGQREHIRLAQQQQQVSHPMPINHAPICYGVSDARCAYEVK